ncbi:TlyA family RNA methyltransferase [Desulforegula conservatrix]|uniref:TlyA family RNA methyltransferase n=1 Tax=Desulforegula conservatrix TaxID=153026 RepID=UPI000412C369|nr:TlyA family RNA methyltransferase [Desulforegula conservatrix]
MKPIKERLDIILFERGLSQSRQRAQAIIMSGRVLVDNEPVDKPGTKVMKDSEIRIKGDDDCPFVSRGGLKIQHAIDTFGMDVTGLVCMDIGASTGGFTDCLIQRGAKKVFAVDVGYGQLAWKLRQDERVISIERTNIRHMPLEIIGEPVDLAAIDTSFISLRIVLPAVLKFLKKHAIILALIKPQFEVGKENVGKGGVVRDSALHDEVVSDLTSFFSETGLEVKGITSSPILGPKGNKEFLILLGYH